MIDANGKYYLTRAEVCIAFDESRATFYRLKHNKALRKNGDFFRKGNRLYYSWEEVQKLKESLIHPVSEEVVKKWEERMKLLEQAASGDPVMPLTPEKSTKDGEKRGGKKVDKEPLPKSLSNDPETNGYQQLSFLSGS